MDKETINEYFFYFETAFQIIIDKLIADNLLIKELDVSRVVFELPRDASHGDIATNAAMVLGKTSWQLRHVI